MSKLLCVSSEWVNEHTVEGYTPRADFDLADMLGGSSTTFLDRNDADGLDGGAGREDWRQVVSYITLWDHQKNVLVYTRGAGGEPLLDAKESLGIGGHVEDVDLEDEQGISRVVSGQSLYRAAKRELFEELSVFSPTDDFRLIGLVRNDDDQVGRRHLGFVFACKLSGGRVEPKEKHIVNPFFVTPGLALTMRPRMERWSQILVDAFFA